MPQVVPVDDLREWVVKCRDAGITDIAEHTSLIPIHQHTEDWLFEFDIMHTFFHGWRRKAGVVALGLALAVTGAWVRSLSNRDVVLVPLYEQKLILAVFASRGRFAVSTENSPSATGLTRCIWTSEPPFMPPFELEWSEWEWLWRRSGYCSDGESFTTWLIVPYWLIAIPLTLLSAYLILGNPRNRA